MRGCSTGGVENVALLLAIGNAKFCMASCIHCRMSSLVYLPGRRGVDDVAVSCTRGACWGVRVLCWVLGVFPSCCVLLLWGVVLAFMSDVEGWVVSMVGCPGEALKVGVVSPDDKLFMVVGVSLVGRGVVAVGMDVRVLVAVVSGLVVVYV